MNTLDVADEISANNIYGIKFCWFYVNEYVFSLRLIRIVYMNGYACEPEHDAFFSLLFLFLLSTIVMRVARYTIISLNFMLSLIFISVADRKWNQQTVMICALNF